MPRTNLASGTLGNPGGIAYAVNEDGVVVGEFLLDDSPVGLCSTAPYVSRAVRVNLNGSGLTALIRDDNDSDPSVPDPNSTARDVNNNSGAALRIGGGFSGCPPIEIDSADFDAVNWPPVNPVILKELADTGWGNRVLAVNDGTYSVGWGTNFDVEFFKRAVFWVG